MQEAGEKFVLRPAQHVKRLDMTFKQAEALVWDMCYKLSSFTTLSCKGLVCSHHRKAEDEVIARPVFPYGLEGPSSRLRWRP